MSCIVFIVEKSAALVISLLASVGSGSLRCWIWICGSWPGVELWTFCNERNRKWVGCKINELKNNHLKTFLNSASSSSRQAALPAATQMLFATNPVIQLDCTYALWNKPCCPICPSSQSSQPPHQWVIMILSMWHFFLGIKFVSHSSIGLITSKTRPASIFWLKQWLWVEINKSPMRINDQASFG